ncbi:penicillin-binding protein 1A [Marinobacter bryozoorum]|uniref:penicillin-binding protein 1A n=1 Tax=Marinobacter bryozoorum TaxID=256324 RepID=UPI002002F616|nr:penicillin-binding protein 1A [Marinobacter bryozoorum]MCK7546010.1 penicillin-binding protein 1A [Marinobacter bryozoorum]
MSRLITASRFFLWLAILGVSSAMLVAAGFYLHLRPELPAVHQLLNTKLQTPLRIYSSDDKLIAEFGEKRRTPVTIDQIPEAQLQAFLAAEDSRFYEHFGVDFIGLTRAAVELASTGEIQSGGSTITMQVARNYFLTRDRTFARKFNEILLSFQIEKELDKQTILELYLNKIYLGNRAYGLAAASQVYYGKPVAELDLAQMAMLAGLPKAPSAFNPLANPERAKVRRDWILGRMAELGYISSEERNEARSQPLTAKYNATPTEVNADYVAEMARSEMVARYGEAAYNDGYRVTVTVGSADQDAATRALQHGLEAYDHRHGYRGPAGTTDDVPADNATYQEILDAYPKVEELYPVIITGINDEQAQATAWSRHLGEGFVPFETMGWARAYRSANALGPKPTRVSDVLSVGDIVYVRRQPPGEPTEPAEDSEAAGDISTLEASDAPIISPVAMALTQIPDVEGALISLQARTGAIRALAGGYSFSQTKYNRAIQAQRQPGSTFKPFIYLKALDAGMTPATIYNDAPIVQEGSETEPGWRPKNSGGEFLGPTRLREALYRSRNMVSIRLLQDLGIDETMAFLDRLKLPTDDLPRELSLALGSGSLTPMDMARGFALIANGGYDVQPYLIQTIENSDGKVLYEAAPTILCDSDCDRLRENRPDPVVGFPAIRVAERLVNEQSVYLLHSMLKDVIKRGTATRARELGRNDLAGKTGTTNDQKDAWFSGFNHEIATTTWVGFDQPQTLGFREFGGTAALPIWMDYMRDTLANRPESEMPRPEGIVGVRIDPRTGDRAASGQDNAIVELFPAHKVPSQRAGNGLSGGNDDANLPRNLF